jgi:NADPH-dependent curcumin reductase CurA
MPSGSPSRPCPGEGSRRERRPHGGVGDDAGLTASHFATDFYPVQPGDIAFVHAAAGGVGLLLTQIIKLRGEFRLDAAKAHADMESRKTTGKQVLVP